MDTPADNPNSNLTGHGEDPTQEVRESTAIIVCRGDTHVQKDEYLSCLESFDFSHMKHVPLLSFKYINQERLERELLVNHKEYHGLLFTSSRAVMALERLDETSKIHEIWKDSLIFAVGDKTSQEISSRLGLVTCTQSKIGNSVSMAESILEVISKKGLEKDRLKFLMPCSCISLDHLPSILLSHGIQVIQIPVYDTCTSSDAEERLTKEIQCFCRNGIKRILVVLFSPSNVESVHKVLKQNFGPQISCVAIGPTTKKALEDKNLAVLSMAKNPDPLSLVYSILESLRQPSN